MISETKKEKLQELISEYVVATTNYVKLAGLVSPPSGGFEIFEQRATEALRRSCEAKSTLDSYISEEL